MVRSQALRRLLRAQPPLYFTYQQFSVRYFSLVRKRPRHEFEDIPLRKAPRVIRYQSPKPCFDGHRVIVVNGALYIGNNRILLLQPGPALRQRVQKPGSGAVGPEVIERPGAKRHVAALQQLHPHQPVSALLHLLKCLVNLQVSRFFEEHRTGVGNGVPVQQEPSYLIRARVAVVSSPVVQVQRIGVETHVLHHRVAVFPVVRLAERHHDLIVFFRVGYQRRQQVLVAVIIALRNPNPLIFGEGYSFFPLLKRRSAVLLVEYDVGDLLPIPVLLDDGPAVVAGAIV